jgi:hypothetical protein
MPPTIRAHNLFHVSLLKKYIHYFNHVIDWTMIQVEPIVQFEVKQNHFGEDEATWDLEDAMGWWNTHFSI